MDPIRVTVWNEYRHERQNAEVARIYPHGIHGALSDGLAQHLGSSVTVRVATLDEPQHGLTQEVLDQTDVLTWWGHLAHDEVDDEVVQRVQRRVWDGMGLIVLHSGHASKIFQRLMGTSCMLRWRDVGEQERLWVVDPSHPIVDGFDAEYFELPAAEMYGEHFDIPPPEELVFISWFAGGEVFRSGCTFRRGKGKIFYFRPGHETFPIYHHPMVRRVLAGAVRWARPGGGVYHSDGRQITQPLNPLK